MKDDSKSPQERSNEISAQNELAIPDLEELRRLVENEPYWSVESGSDLTMDGKSTPTIVTTETDGRFINFARGNRNFYDKAVLAGAAVNSLLPLLDYITRLELVVDSAREILSDCDDSESARGYCVGHGSSTRLPCPHADLRQTLCELDRVKKASNG